ncbi:MAG TPA: hypothetical protein DCS93_27780 [Microscillaceae bacterium]|nr:hypothetical protein [Microscillaceae bacterium]
MRFSLAKIQTISSGILQTFTPLLLLICWLLVQQANAQMLSWANSLGSTAKFEQGDQVLTDQAGNIYIAGLFSGTVDFDFSTNKTELTAQGGSDAFFAKYNANRELQWVKSISGTVAEDITQIVLDGAGNLYITGIFGGTTDFDSGPQTQTLTSAGSDDVFLAKYTTNGEYQWAFRIGGSQGDFGGNLVLDSQGDIYLAGAFRGANVDFDPGTGTQNLSAVGSSNSMFVAKYSSDGAYQWVFRVGAATDFKAVTVNGLAFNTTTNELIVVGEHNGVADYDPGSNTANLDEANGTVFIAKYTTDGNYVLAKNFGTTDARSLVLDNAGNIYICGNYTGSDVDFDPGAGTAKLTSKGSGDWFIAKYNTSIELQWVKGLGSATSSDFPEGIALDASNNVYVTGNFEGELSFNDPSNTVKIQSKGSADALLVSYDKDGNYRFAHNIGGTNFDTTNDIFIDPNTNGIYLTGSYTNMAEFAINNGISTTLTSQGDEDIFLVLYGTPEINLIFNNRNIASGTTLNFGNVSIGNNSVDSTIAIENKGVIELILNGTAGSLITLSGTNTNDFKITQTEVTPSISAGSQVTFTVSYIPSVAGAASALLTIQSNDSDEGTYMIQLAGTGVNNVTSIAEQATNLVWKVGPNPTTGQVTINSQKHASQSIHYQIVDQKGRIVLSRTSTLNNGTVTINFDQIPKGHYLLILQTGDKQITKRIVKR